MNPSLRLGQRPKPRERSLGWDLLFELRAEASHDHASRPRRDAEALGQFEMVLAQEQTFEHVQPRFAAGEDIFDDEVQLFASTIGRALVRRPRPMDRGVEVGRSRA